LREDHVSTTEPLPNHFLNRELSWLEFNGRVLHEAFDERNPLFERLKFLSIFSTNLDEFYMVRIAGLRRQVAAGVVQPSFDGLTPAETLAAVGRRVAQQLEEAQACLQGQLLPALADRGVRLVTMGDLTPAEWLAVDEFFESQVFPVLTPLAVDPGHPFPYISNLSLSLAVEIRDPVRRVDHFARVKVPKSLPRWVPFGRPNHFVPLEHVIGANLGALFPGMEVLGWYAFRVTRYSDLDVGKVDEAEDLLEMIEQQVFERRFSEVVRLEVQPTMPAHLRTLLLDELREDTAPNVPPLTTADVQEPGALLDLGDLMSLGSLDFPELHDAPFTALVPPELRDGRSVFEAIRERDILVHHPFESFSATVEHFLAVAADDPAVLAIKMTLYRTSGDATIVHALARAAEQGKQVAVLVELQARGDEAANISWARTLENAGVHVAYGVPGLKTHAKCTLVVRRDGDGIRRYVHIGTGNYNSKTARLYTDLGLFTCSPSIGADVSDLFNSLTGFSRQRLYRKLLVAPANMLSRFLEMIDREADLARDGRGGRIIAKMNALVHPEVIEALYRASQAGVEIDLIVRGICCLRPGVPGQSERIRVTSIIGRFLEHSRIWVFSNGGEAEYYIGSADWMPRNLERRVECVTPVEDPTLHFRLDSVIATCLADNRQVWELQADGSYRQRRPDGGAERATHRLMLRDPWGRVFDGALAAPSAPAAAPAPPDELPSRSRREERAR
jgi:polyphosphate kinase